MIPSFIKRFSSSLSHNASDSLTKAKTVSKEVNEESSHVEERTEVTLRRQKTYELDTDNSPSPTRQSSRTYAIASVREATKKLSSRTSKTFDSTSKVYNLEGLEKYSKGLVPPALSHQGTGNSKKSIGLSRNSSKKRSSVQEISTDNSTMLAVKSRLSGQKRPSSSFPADSLRGKSNLWFPRKAFLAVRSDESTSAPNSYLLPFYLCRTSRNIYNYTKEVPIQWLTQEYSGKILTLAGAHFRTTYKDKIDPASVLMQVHLDKVAAARCKYRLPSDQISEIMRLLKLTENFEKGELSLNDLDDDVEQVVQVDEPPAKKPKLVKSASQKLREKAVGRALKKKTPGSRNPKTLKRKRSASQKGEKEPKKKRVAKAVACLELHPRPDIKVLEEDPLFESRTTMPYVSKVANSRLIFRAIYLRDYKMLSKLLKDGNKIFRLYTKSVDNPETPLTAAVKVGDVNVFKILLHEFSGTKFKHRLKNNEEEHQLLDKMDTGRYNQASLGIRFIRKITASRGSREGNNAFLDKERSCSSGIDCFDLLNTGLDSKLLEVLTKFLDDRKERLHNPYQLYDILLAGHNKAAGTIIENEMKSLHSGYNHVFRDVLMFDTEDLTNCPPSSLKGVRKLTPFHCAATNPNPKYMEHLLKIQPDVNIPDGKGRRPIHYAAGCSSDGSLKALLDWGASANDTDSSRMIPLHYAVQANRPHNVKLLLEKAKSNTIKDMCAEKYGVGGINRPDQHGSLPLHFAVRNGFVVHSFLAHKEMVKVLLSFGANVNSKSSVSSMQICPLMLAARNGDLAMVRLLVDKGAVVEQKDRLGRTALIHACKNGATNVLSYLLHIGANGQLEDNSGNTPLHYAAAYGWHFTLKLLLEYGSDPNAINMWRTTPVSIAYMKGHIGIVRELLNSDKVDINFPDDDGVTLVFRACQSDLLQADLYEQIHYLVEEKGALCSTKDRGGQTPLHYLAASRIGSCEQKDVAFNQSVQIAKLLVKHGCDVNAVDSQGFTAGMVALGMNFILPLAEYLLKVGSQVLLPPEGDRTTSVLHKLAKNMWNSIGNAMKVVALMDKHGFSNELKKMKVYVDSLGFSPLHIAITDSNAPSIISRFDPKEEKERKKQQKKQWDDALDFICFLAQDSAIDLKVEKKRYTLDIVAEPNSPDWYFRANSAEKTAAHLVLAVRDPGFDTDGNIVDTSHGTIFRTLVKMGADVNAKDLSGKTILGTLISLQRENLIHFLADHGKCNFNLLFDEIEGRQPVPTHPLLYACRTRNTRVIRALLESGCDCNAMIDKSGTRCLHLLISNNTPEIELLNMVDVLAHQGFNFNHVDNKKRTVMHYAIRKNKGLMNESFELEVKLIQLGAALGCQDCKGRTPLHYVFKKEKSSRSYRYNQMEASDPAELAKLVGQSLSTEEINLKDKDGKTALHYAANQGATICCMYLLMVGADLSIQDRDGNTALSMAVMKKHDGCATILIQSGACLQSQVVTISEMLRAKRKQEEKKQQKAIETDNGSDESESDKEGSTDKGLGEKAKQTWVWTATKHVRESSDIHSISLYQAAITNNLNGVAMFVTEADSIKSGMTTSDAIKIAMDTKRYNIALRLVCTTTDSKKLLQPRELKRNLLHVLALSCHNYSTSDSHTKQKIAKRLVDFGVSITATDHYGCSPIQYAILNRDFHLADYLAEQSGGYKVDYTDGFGRSHLAAVMWRCHSQGISQNTWQFVLKLIELKVKLDQYFDLPLNPDLCLLNNATDPEYFQRYPQHKTTALIVAITTTGLHMSGNFLKSGANPNIPDGKGLTPLMHAIILNKTNNVKQLMNYDYDISNPDKFTGMEVQKPADVPKKAEKKKRKQAVFQLKAANEDQSSSDDTDDSDEDNAASKVQETQNRRKNLTNAQEYKPVQKTSAINLNAMDGRKLTALHLLAQPHPMGTFDNAEISFVLAKAGAKITNSGNETPFVLAIKSGALKVAGVLKKEFKLPDQKLNTAYVWDFPVDDGITKNNIKVQDFKQAADKVLRKYESNVEMEDIYVHEVDENCTVTNGQLLEDEELKLPYDVLLTNINVDKGTWGLYNFYQMQLVFEPSRNLNILFTRWGRIEDSGQYQHTPFTDRAAAVKEFMKLFQQKTGNKWKDIKDFKQKPKKYRLVEDVARKVPPPQKDVKIVLETSCTSHLPLHLHSVIQTMMDPKQMQLSMEGTCGLSTKALPFGQLNKERLLQGKELLTRLEELVDEVEEYRKISEPGPEKKEAYKHNLEKIGQLSNDYYHVIPQKNFSCEKIRPLDSRSALMKQVYSLNNLLDYEIACKMLLAAMANRTAIHPVEYVYRCLDCKMELMKETDLMSQLILKTIWDTAVSKVKVQAIYKLCRKGEQERLKATKIENRHLLWHGSSNSNMLSILSRGLLVSPPEASVTAWRFGKGIYFADAFYKSSHYVAKSKTNFVLLCEVALGKQYSYTNSEESDTQENIENHDSTVAEGYNGFRDWLVLNSGAKIPYGGWGRRTHPDPTKSYVTSYSEYIIRDPAQACMRYLIQYTN